LFVVVDENGMSNQLLYKSPGTANAERLFVFFPGDISDFPGAVSADALTAGDPELARYDFTLDSIARQISEQISPEDALVLFRPSRMMGHFSIYSNFVECDWLGLPDWEGHRRQERNPGKLILEFLEDLRRQQADNSLSDKTRLILIGFSKGSIVISSLLEDMNRALFSRVEKIILIDPGLPRPGILFPLHREKFSPFPKGIPIRIYASPYCRNERVNEMMAFANESGARLQFILTDHDVSLNTHFKAITVAIEQEKKFDI